MHHSLCRLLENRNLGGRFYKLTFAWDGKAVPLPGQFFTIRVSGLTDPLLRRPFAFSGFHPERKTASAIIEIRGRGTTILSKKRANDDLDIIGPLGNSFTMPEKRKRPIIISGGIGLGPMLFLGKHLRNSGLELKFIFGCRTADCLPAAYEDLEDLQAEICTDDGSSGFKGTTVDFLESIPASDPNLDPNRVAIYCCGPAAMLKAVADFARSRNLPCWVSMEQIIACGVGACAGCVIRTTNPPGYSRVCQEGPVYNSENILWT